MIRSDKISSFVRFQLNSLSASFSYGISFFQRREKEFDDYLREKYVQAKTDFRELLKETKVITYR